MKGYLSRFLREAHHLGIEQCSLTPVRKSIKFTGVIAGERIIYFLAKTPSDNRAIDNAIAELRRLVRQTTGDTEIAPKRLHRALADGKKMARSPRRHPPTCALPSSLTRSLALPTRLSRDPWAPLEALRTILAARPVRDASDPPSPTARRKAQ